jgi:hypothetical protein
VQSSVHRLHRLTVEASVEVAVHPLWASAEAEEAVPRRTLQAEVAEVVLVVRRILQEGVAAVVLVARRILKEAMAELEEHQFQQAEEVAGEAVEALVGPQNRPLTAQQMAVRAAQSLEPAVEEVGDYWV